MNIAFIDYLKIYNNSSSVRFCISTIFCLCKKTAVSVLSTLTTMFNNFLGTYLLQLLKTLVITPLSAHTNFQWCA